MITTTAKKVIGALALATALCAGCAPDPIPRLDGKDLTNFGLEQLKKHGAEALELSICNFQLDKLPLSLGTIIPCVTQVWMRSIPPPEASPREDQKAAISLYPCKVRDLGVVWSSFGSPKNIEWIKVFFPSLTNLMMAPDALPIQNEQDLKMCRDGNLSLENVRTLRIVSPNEECNPPIFENLRLFPNLETVSFFRYANFSTQGNVQESSEPLLLIRNVEFDDTPVNWEFFSKLPEMLPNIGAMEMRASLFNKVTSEYGASSTPLEFKNLKELVVDCGGYNEDLDIGENIADVFPSLLKITILRPGEIHLPSSSAKAHPLVEAVTIAYGGKVLPSDYFGSVFPKVTPQSFMQFDCDSFDESEVTLESHLAAFSIRGGQRIND